MATSNPRSRTSATLLPQRQVLDRDRGIAGQQRGHGSERGNGACSQCLHLDTRWTHHLGAGLDLDAALGQARHHVYLRGRQRMAQGDKPRGLLRRLDARHAACLEQLHPGGRHRGGRPSGGACERGGFAGHDATPRNGPPPGPRLAGDVDHACPPGAVDMGEPMALSPCCRRLLRTGTSHRVQRSPEGARQRCRLRACWN